MMGHNEILARRGGKCSQMVKLLVNNNIINFWGRLKQALHISKRNCFEKLYAEANQNPRGTRHRVVMKKMSGASPTTFLDLVMTLFPP